LDEKKTRKELIDPALEKAGWDIRNPNQVGIEIPVDGFDPEAWIELKNELRQISEQRGVYEVNPPAGISDYVLYRENGEILAVVEAKKTSIDPRLAEAQTAFYIREIEKLPQQSFRPFGFMTNGREIYFWDMGEADRRKVFGFFSREDLERLLFMRQQKTPLAKEEINLDITDRGYQIEGVRRVCEDFENGHRKALIVMATGTGKTRVAMSLVDLFFRRNQARNILFVADRDALVTQALKEGFEEHIPNEPATRIFTTSIDKSKRLYVVTLQTLSNCFQEFTPSFFDLIIFDEVHRSIFNKWNEVLQYFDGRMIGLTATPAAHINRNTFLEFERPDEIPTALYERKQAVDEEYLVDFELYRAQTHFQRAGIHGIDLSEEERNALIEKGIDPDEIDYSGTEIERTVSNVDTLRKMWMEFWDVARKDPGGLPGKTIVFAMTQEHALRLQEAFQDVFKEFSGLSTIITYKSEYKGTLIKSFKHENLPRIAISVDMLETGVNIPEVVNLVFMRPVQSPIKMEQMIGRGTRTHETCKYPERLPEEGKQDFLIIDFWENDFSKEPKRVTTNLPVAIKIFNNRLKLLDLYLEEDRLCESDECRDVVAFIREQIDTIPRDSISIQIEINTRPEIERVWEDAFWEHLGQGKLDFLTLQVGPLLRFAPGGDISAATFTNKVERLKLNLREGNQRAAAHTAESIAGDVVLLPDFVRKDESKLISVHLGCNPHDLLQANPGQLNRLARELAEEMKRRQRPDTFHTLDLGDFIESQAYILLTSRGEEVYVEDYRRMVEQRVLDLAVAHPTIATLEQGEAISDEQLLALERTLREALGGPELELSEINVRKAYGEKVDSLIAFLRNLLDLEGLPDYGDILERQFAQFMVRNQFNADQTRFLRVVQHTLKQRKQLQTADLYESPFTRFGAEAVERLFSQNQITEMMELVDQLAVVPF